MTVEEYNESLDLYADSLYRFLKKNMGDAEKAEDVVQDTFEKLWTEHESVEYINMRAYIYTSAYHFMIREVNRVRDFGHLRNENLDELGGQGGDQYSDHKDVLDKILQGMPPEQRTAVLLRDYEGYTYEEIAVLTGTTAVNVRKYVYRARESFKKYLVSIENII
ncbi:MAG TPA: RNA polymerase sigma factor [Bacteroidia bacterium]|jgi:RNA polymerase sigma-70 factor (ECF subfamily)|nr:RNA polymerase sigma factor [Bacteroidia bacterium]